MTSITKILLIECLFLNSLRCAYFKTILFPWTDNKCPLVIINTWKHTSRSCVIKKELNVNTNNRSGNAEVNCFNKKTVISLLILKMSTYIIWINILMRN